MEEQATDWNEDHFSNEELDAAAVRLEEWRNEISNWVGDEIPKKRKRQDDAPGEVKADLIKKPKQGEEESDEESKISAEERKMEAQYTFFVSRCEDFKLFLERRIPPDNEKAQSVLNEYKNKDLKDWVDDLRSNRLWMMSKLGGLHFAFQALCDACGMSQKDFVDRSLERPDITTEEGREQLLCQEINYFTLQLKELMQLANELPE